MRLRQAPTSMFAAIRRKRLRMRISCTTDVWASMGFEAEQKERELAFANYQVNEALVKYAKKDYLFMHCLPAHRGEEVSEGVIDGKHSIIFDQAENRLHAQKAIMAAIM